MIADFPVLIYMEVWYGRNESVDPFRSEAFDSDYREWQRIKSDLEISAFRDGDEFIEIDAQSFMYRMDGKSIRYSYTTED